MKAGIVNSFCFVKRGASTATMNQYDSGIERSTHPKDQPAVYITPMVPTKVPADVWVAAIVAPPVNQPSSPPAIQ
jgi:hypothetical protein